MQITLNTAESSEAELTALIALLASLGGRLPDVRSMTVKLTADTSDVRAALAKIEAGEDCDDDPVSTGNPEMSEDDGGTPEAPAVDSKGTPWDARIHSESKATVADGTWRKRRGVSDELFDQVMRELKDAALIGHPDQDEAPPPPPADEPEGNDEQVPAPPAPTEETPSEPAPAASAPAAGEPDATGGQFPDFPAFVGAVSKHGKTYAELNEMAGMLGVAMFKDMKDHPDKWDMFFSMIG